MAIRYMESTPGFEVGDQFIINKTGETVTAYSFYYNSLSLDTTDVGIVLKDGSHIRIKRLTAVGKDKPSGDTSET